MNAIYLKILLERYKYFESKSITELTNDEIQEYLNLQKEIVNAMPQVKETFDKIWNIIKEVTSPYVEAQMQYEKRVKKC
jgi:uncharacterized protein YjgD (DUF1641 family)